MSTKEEGLTANTQQALEDVHHGLTTQSDSEARAAIAQTDKDIKTAAAELDRIGYAMHVIDAGHGRPAFLIMRWDRSREVETIEEVQRFIRMAGGNA